MIPPIMHQATVLGEAGYEVDLVHLAGPTPERATNHDGTCLRGANVRPVCAGIKRGRRTSAANFLRVLARASALAKRSDYAAFWGYDYFGFYVAHRLARAHPHARVVFHQNELYEASSLRMGARWLFNYHVRNINDADLVVIPDKNRAKRFQQQTGLAREPFVAGNFPLLMERDALPIRTPGTLDGYFPNADPKPRKFVLNVVRLHPIAEGHPGPEHGPVD